MQMKSLVLVLLGLVIGCSLHAAPQQAESKEKPAIQIAIVALGPLPPRRYRQSKGGDSVMLLPKPGEIPPMSLYYKGKKSTEKKTAWQSLRIAFNSSSRMQAFPAEQSLTLYLKKKGEVDSYKKYLTIPAGKEGSRMVVFLIPAGKGLELWEKEPLIESISLDVPSLRGKQFILKNLSSFTVQHAFEKTVTSVPPMKTISYEKGPKKGELYRLAARYGREKKIIYNTAVKLDTDGNIQLFALYNASPKTNSGRSVGVFRMMIPAPAKPKPILPPPSETP